MPRYTEPTSVFHTEPFSVFEPQPFICVPRRLYDVRRASTETQRIALLKAKTWPNGSQLKIAFKGANEAQKRKVERTVREIEEFANLSFSFGTPAEIRITFERGGAWSFIGTDALQQARDQATMNLGFGLEDTGPNAGTYRHEFGHALGAIHEHQNPRGGIAFDREAVIRDLSGPPNNWDMETIERNIFESFSLPSLNGSEFDPRSVMLYPIPEKWTVDGFSSTPNSNWSEMDKRWLSKQYPKSSQPDDSELQVISLAPLKESIGVAGEKDLLVFESLGGEHYIEAIPNYRYANVVLSLFGPNSRTKLLKTVDDVDGAPNFSVNLDRGAYWLQVSHASASGVGSYALRVMSLDGAPLPGGNGGGDGGEGVAGRLVLPQRVEAGAYELRR